MRRFRTLAAACAALLLAACGAVETASRNAPFDLQPVTGAQVAPTYTVAAYEVRVPRELKVSEANLFFPPGDIVWRGEPLGDRHAQVENIFRDSIEMSRAHLPEGRPAKLDIEVKRFHGISEKARYTTGGVHAITFEIRLLDPETGLPLGATRTVRADLDAFGGARAMAADARGETQRVRITSHLSRVLATELTDPAS